MGSDFLPTCAFHDERLAEDRCMRCQTALCETCTTIRHDMALCPTCLSGPTVLMRELEIEGHLQAIGLVDLAAAGAFLAIAIVGAFLLDSPPWLSTAGGLAALFALLGLGLRRYHPMAGALQVALSLGLILTPFLGGLRNLGAGLSLAFVGGFSLWALLNEAGRECFTSYYRETVAASREEPPMSFFLGLVLLLATLEAVLRLVFFS